MVSTANWNPLADTSSEFTIEIVTLVGSCNVIVIITSIATLYCIRIAIKYSIIKANSLGSICKSFNYKLSILIDCVPLYTVLS